MKYFWITIGCILTVLYVAVIIAMVRGSYQMAKLEEKQVI